MAAKACSAHLSKDYNTSNFCLLGEGSNACVCRRVKSGGKLCVRPVVALEDLESLFAEQHQALGHPGFETLYLQVSRQGTQLQLAGVRQQQRQRFAAFAALAAAQPSTAQSPSRNTASPGN